MTSSIASEVHILLWCHCIYDITECELENRTINTMINHDSMFDYNSKTLFRNIDSPVYQQIYMCFLQHGWAYVFILLCKMTIVNNKAVTPSL